VYVWPEKSTIVRTTGETRVSLRVVPARDAERVVDAVFAGLSASSRYFRFHSPVPRLSEPLRRQLVDLDGRHRAAVVAEAVDDLGPTPIGIVRLADTGRGSAEVAVAVVDAWHRRGVGRRLLAAVADLAEELGYTELRGRVLRENLPMRRLTHSAFPWARMGLDDDTIEIVAPIGPAAETITHEDVLADLLYRGG
jgi:GNAT superfamily N-acetyltransferase